MEQFGCHGNRKRPDNSKHPEKFADLFGLSGRAKGLQ